MIHLLFIAFIYIITGIVLPLFWTQVFPQSLQRLITFNNAFSFIYGWWIFLGILSACIFLWMWKNKKLSNLTTTIKMHSLALVPFLIYLFIPIYVSEKSVLKTVYYKKYLNSELWKYILFFSVLSGVIFFLVRYCRTPKTSPVKQIISESGWNKVFIFILIVYLAGTMTAALFEYSIFENWEDMDTNVQSYAQTMQGNFFVSYLERLSFKGMNVMLGTHNRPILLLILPFYAVFQTGETLLVIKTLFIGLSAIPLYLLFKRKTKAFYALIITLSYLFFPPLISQNFTGFHEVCMAPLLIACGLYFFEAKRLGWFILFYILALMVKEHIGIILLPYCVLAIIRKRDWRWAVYPAVLSFIWIFITFFIVFPLFRPDDCLIYAHYAVKSHGETGIMGLVSNILMNPGETFQTISDRFYFIYVYFAQGLFILPFFSFESLFLVLPFVKNVLFFPYNAPVTFHHSMISAAFLFYCTGLVLTRIITKHINNNETSHFPNHSIVLFLVIGATIINVPIWVNTINLHPVYELEEMKAAIQLIPDGSMVAAPMNMTQKLAPRCSVVYLDYQTIKGEQAVDYIIINMNRDFRPIARSPKKGFIENGALPGYEKIWEKKGVIILKKTR